MARHRLGVALLIDEPVRTEIQGLRRALSDPARNRIDPHVTLVAPVNVREEELDGVWAVLRGAARQVGGPLHMCLAGVDTFAPRNPVLYLPVVGPDLGAVNDLRGLVNVAPLARPDRPDRHSFVPHVTICRAASDDQLTAAPAAFGAFEADITFAGVDLLEETREEDGVRRWRSIGRATFPGPMRR